MLLSFGAKNFFCFKEWTIISLALNSKVPTEVSKGLKAALTLCLKGGNASGKTNALKIPSFIEWFCTNSFNEKPETKVMIETFFNNDEPSEFFMEFEIDGIQYVYELVLTKEVVLSEKIYKKEKRNTLVFHRKKNLIVKNSLTKKLKSDLLVRNNASIISSSKQQEIKEFEPFYNFFFNISTNVSYFGLRTKDKEEYIKTSEFYNFNKEFLQFTLNYLKKFDSGIEDIQIKTVEDEEKKKVYFPVFTHTTDDKKHPLLLYHSQSSGTKSLYNLLADYNLTLKFGGVRILDEFDINLHPDILPHLVELFENPETNPKHAQLIFSTHNSDIVDIMGKYKTYLFNKEAGECYCYRLDELKDNIIRNDRPISPLYKAGKIGGVPRI